TTGGGAAGVEFLRELTLLVLRLNGFAATTFEATGLDS
ncbi:unnamed protein product, partial [Allacma fusca]